MIEAKIYKIIRFRKLQIKSTAIHIPRGDVSVVAAVAISIVVCTVVGIVISQNFPVYSL